MNLEHEMLKELIYKAFWKRRTKKRILFLSSDRQAPVCCCMFDAYHKIFNQKLYRIISLLSGEGKWKETTIVLIKKSLEGIINGSHANEEDEREFSKQTTQVESHFPVFIPRSFRSSNSRSIMQRENLTMM